MDPADGPPIPVHDGRVLLRRLHAEADGLPFEIDLFLPEALRLNESGA